MDSELVGVMLIWRHGDRYVEPLHIGLQANSLAAMTL